MRERSDRRERGRPGRSGLGARVPRQGHRRATAEVARPPPHGAALFFLDPSERRIPPRHGIRSESPSPAPAWPADRCESIPGRDAPAPALGGAAAAEPGRVVNKTRLAAAPPRVTPLCVVYFAVQLRAADSRAHALANVRRPLRDRETGRGPSAASANCPSWGGAGRLWVPSSFRDEVIGPGCGLLGGQERDRPCALPQSRDVQEVGEGEAARTPQLDPHPSPRERLAHLPACIPVLGLLGTPAPCSGQRVHHHMLS